MAFDPAASRTPNAIGDMEITLFTPGANSPHQAGANYRLKVHYSDGSVVERSGNLVPHLTQQQINGLLAFMSDLRTQANNQILPQP